MMRPFSWVLLACWLATVHCETVAPPLWLVNISTESDPDNADLAGGGCYGVLVADNVVLTAWLCPLTTTSVVSLVHMPAKRARVLAFALHPEAKDLSVFYELNVMPVFSVQAVLLDRPFDVAPARVATSKAPSQLTTLLPDIYQYGGASYPKMIVTTVVSPVEKHVGRVATPCRGFFDETYMKTNWIACQRIGTVFFAGNVVYGMVASGMAYTDSTDVANFMPLSHVASWISRTRVAIRTYSNVTERRRVCEAMFPTNKLVLVRYFGKPSKFERCAIIDTAGDTIAHFNKTWNACTCGPFGNNVTAASGTIIDRFGMPLEGFKFPWRHRRFPVFEYPKLGTVDNACRCTPYSFQVAAPRI